MPNMYYFFRNLYFWDYLFSKHSVIFKKFN